MKLTPNSASLIKWWKGPFCLKVNSDHLRQMVLYYNLTNIHSNRVIKVFSPQILYFPPTLTNAHFSNLSAIAFPAIFSVVPIQGQTVAARYNQDDTFTWNPNEF